MKLSTLTGLALAGALVAGSAAPAWAQMDSFDPYYLAPKILYSHDALKDFSAKGSFEGIVGPQRRINAKDTTDGTFGAGFAIGYDFGAYTEYPIRVEFEYMHRGNLSQNSDTQMIGSTPGYSLSRPGHPNTFGPSWMEDYGYSQLYGNAEVKNKVQTLMVNFMLDFPTETAFTPYVQAGLGGAYVDSKATINMYGRTSDTNPAGGNWTSVPNGSEGPRPGHDGSGSYEYGINHRYTGQQNTWNLAWNVGAGFSYQIKDNLALDLSYRYSDFGDVQFGTNGYTLHASRRNENYDPTAGGDHTFPSVEVGKGNFKGKSKLSAHEVVLGLRITSF